MVHLALFSAPAIGTVHFRKLGAGEAAGGGVRAGIKPGLCTYWHERGASD